jgi:hypothetical protein
MTDPIDLEQVRQRRAEAKINENQEQWETVKMQLMEIMSSSGLADTSLISATLAALLLMIDRGDIVETKRRVALTLNVFTEIRQP